MNLIYLVCLIFIGQVICTYWGGENFEAGYITTNQDRGHNLFYLVFESRNDYTTDPVLLWSKFY